MSRHSSSRLAISLAVLGMLVSPVLGVNWVLSEGKAIAISRIDPIVNPGDVAGHVHNIIGGSKFSKDASSPAEQQQSKCSSMNVQADKSNYWAPQVFYRYPDNTLSPMLGSARIYYFNTAGDVKPFPPGLKLLSGMTMSRNETDIRSFGLKISCDHGEQTSKLPTKQSHPGGCSVLTTGIFFPSCGKADGSLDSDDHFSHMMWPHHFKGSEPWMHPAGAHCPESHPIHYPAIFLEHNYWFSKDQPWRNEDDLIVLSNGDTTGLAYHADFHNGWDQNVLTQAIAQCQVGDAVENCAPFKPSVSIEKAWDCRLEGELPAEEVGLYNSLPNLPGCNPLWTAGMPDTKPTCADPPATPGFVAPNSYFRSDWQRMNIPLTLPEATADKLTSWYKPEVFQGMAPKPGGGSSIIVWGSEDTAKYVKVSTVDDVLANFVANNGSKVEGAAPAPAASSSAAAAPLPSSSAVAPGATKPSSSPLPNPVSPGTDELGNVHLADGAASVAPSSAQATVTVTQNAPAATVTVVDQSCRRSNKKRLLARKAGQIGDTLRSHISRRSRRRAVHG